MTNIRVDFPHTFIDCHIDVVKLFQIIYFKDRIMPIIKFQHHHNEFFVLCGLLPRFK